MGEFNEIPLTEPAILPDIFASGLADVEDLGDGSVRLIFYALQRPLGRTGPAERVAVAKVVMLATAVPETILKMGTVSGCRSPGFGSRRCQ